MIYRNSDLTIEQLAFGTVILVILKIKKKFNDFLLSIMGAEDDYVEVPMHSTKNGKFCILDSMH